MPTDTKQLTADEVIVRLIAIQEFSECHKDEWRNEVARDLNRIVSREIYMVGTHGHASDYAAAVLRIVERVAKFENIEMKEKPNV